MVKKNFFVYIINLKKDKKRKQSIISELIKQKINNYKIIDAVDGNSLKKAYLNKNVYKNKFNNNKWNISMSLGQIGCALSQLKIYKIFIKSKYDLAFILEDDAIFKYNFKEELKNLIFENFKEQKQIILLSELKEFIKKPISSSKNFNVVKVTNAFFTHAYFINKSAAQSILEFNFPVKTIADNYTFFNIYCGVKIFGIDPFIVDQDKKNHPTTIKFSKKLKSKINNENKKFLFKKRIYKLKTRFIKLFVPFSSHSK